MTKEALLNVIATVMCSAPDRYRRAGVGFKHGEQQVEVTREQLAVIKTDPRLKVLSEAPAPEAAPEAAKAKPVKAEAKA